MLPCRTCIELVHPISSMLRWKVPRGVWKVMRSLLFTESNLWSKATKRSNTP